MLEEKKVIAEKDAPELQRGIKGWQVTFIGLGGVIGSCYFLGLGLTIQTMGPAVIIGFGIVGVIIYAVMVAYAELLVNLPRKGSFVSYTKEFLGPQWSIGMGWAFWCNWVAYVPSEAVAMATVLQYLTGSTSVTFYIATAVGAMAAITVINSCAVNIFAKIESGLAITKVIIIILFVILAFGIWVGLWGSDEFLGGKINFGGDISFAESMFPKGALIVFTQMTLVLVTCQGTEIVGLAAAESQDPERSVPKACRSVTWRLLGLYIIPIILVLLIYPWDLANDSNPVFADIMNRYDMGFFGTVMSAVVFVAAFSCANTGFYGTVRAMYGLACEGLAPKFLTKLTKNGNPRNCVWFTLACMWVVLVLGLISELTGALETLYGSLLSISGFTGTLAWIGICLSQVVMKSRLRARGYDPRVCLKAKVSDWLEWLPFAGACVQVIALVMLVIEDQLVFGIALAAVVVPMLVRWINVKRGTARDVVMVSEGEKSFDETFPDLTKKGTGKDLA
ncbi:amino acid permease [Eubacteriales bacterium DFI.9.88]|nr:amino acid permease [Eubacteriales bacterium DFI.9.88]